MTYRFAFAVFGILMFCGPLLSPEARAADSYPTLPPGPNRDVVIKVCSGCHTPEQVSTQKHDRPGWETLIGAMQSNGAAMSDEEFDQVAAYLTASFPPEK